MRAGIPTLHEVQQLPQWLERTMPAEFADANGHVNVRNYLALFDDTGWAFFASLGIDEAYLARRRASVFDAEHHLWYHAEVQIGAHVAVHLRALGRSDKAFHGMCFLADLSEGRIASTFEFVIVHVDIDERRGASIPHDVANPFDALVAEHAQLTWPAPVSGTLEVTPARVPDVEEPS